MPLGLVEPVKVAQAWDEQLVLIHPDLNKKHLIMSLTFILVLGSLDIA